MSPRTNPNEINKATAKSAASGILRRGGGSKHLKIACPKCAAPSIVEVRMLPFLLQCPGCSNSFWVDRTGHIQSEHELGTSSIACPRCRQTRKWPKGAAVKQLRCLSCGFDIPIEADDAPVSLSERLAGKEPEKRSVKPKPPRKTSLVFGTAGLVASVFAFFAIPFLLYYWMTYLDPALVDAAKGFTTAVATGDIGKARAWVTPGQDESFGNWTLTNPASASAPPQDFQVKALKYRSTAALIRVSFLRSGTNIETQNQAWHRSPGGSWQFDAAASLQLEQPQPP